MTRVVIKSGFVTPEDRQEELAEFMCDWPACPNIATRVLGCVKELGLATAVCEEHGPARALVRSATETIGSSLG